MATAGITYILLYGRSPLSSTFNVGHSLRPPILSKVDKATKAGSNVTQPAVVGLWPSFYSFFYL